ncbi:carbohydrate ABC transporter permease [Paenibacillus sp. 1P07SE]|uniref:carbohydrate ABC transporter permease n=1 Tax=Paenibacillus sp. 1P07SE TaxID=3132209 RepID=UPI0039A75EA8
MKRLNLNAISRSKLNMWLWGWFMVAPTIIGLLILNIIPIFQTIYLSLFKSGDFGKGNVFVGVDNYVRMFGDAQVWHAVVNTIAYTLMVVPVSVALAIIIAVLLNGKVKGKSLFRTIYFIPMIAAPAAVTMVWRWLYNPQFGLINYGLVQAGLDPVKWTTDPQVALIAISIIGIWSIFGYNMVLLLASLQEIPRDYYEASDIDGASKLQQFFIVTIPLVTPTLFFVFVTTIIQSMQVFDVIYMMIDVTNPAYERTVSLVYLFYNNSFKYMDKGYGSSIIVLLLAMIMIFTYFQLKAEKKWVHYR